MITEDLITYYVDLLIMQYKALEKARGTVEAYIKQAVADQIGIDVRDGYNIDTAVGLQLDILAKYVGVTRRINGLDITKTYFAMPGYDDASPDTYAGFQVYADLDADIVNFFSMYSDAGNVYSMNDEELRQTIKFKIRVNKSDCSLYDIDDIIDEFFGADCLVDDSTAQTLTYVFTPGLAYNLPKIVVFLGILPKPAGVEIITTGI